MQGHNQVFVSELIKECDKGFVYEPFKTKPLGNRMVSPVSLATNTYLDKKHLILHLSSPHLMTFVNVSMIW